MKGRRPKGKKQSRLAGRGPVAADGLLSALPRCPAWLPKEARKYWKRVGKALVEKRVLSANDLPAFELLCLNYAEVVAITGALALDSGFDISDKDRTLGLMRLLNTAKNTYRQACAEFGLTPRSRGSVETGTGDGEGDFGL